MSRALSVSKQETKKKKKFTKPIDIDSALKYLKEHGCGTVDYYKYTAALQDNTILVGFLAMRSYEERKRYLNDLWAKGMVNAPALGNAPPGLQ